MKCPQCGSANTEKVSVLDPKWKSGAERCLDCGYMDNFIKFCGMFPGRKDIVIG